MNDETLKVESTHVPCGKHETRSMSASLDGRYLSVVSHDGTAWMFDSQSNAPADVSLRGQGGISVSYFAPNGSFYVGDGFGRVTEYNPEKAFEVVETREPSADVVQSVYTWIVEPVYRVFPKPGEMGSIVYWLLTEQDTVVAGDPNDNRIKRQSIDVWHPLWANTAFLVVMLGITCFYISRRDF